MKGEGFIANDFRTWAATVLVAWALYDLREAASQAVRNRSSVRAVEYVTKHLGNAPAVWRKSYLHPAILYAYLKGKVINPTREHVRRDVSKAARGFQANELGGSIACCTKPASKVL